MPPNRIIWIFWCLWILSVTQLCNADQYINITAEEPKSVVKEEGQAVTWTCQFSVNETIPRGVYSFWWLENTTQETLIDINIAEYGIRKHKEGRAMSSYSLPATEIKIQGCTECSIDKTNQSSSLNLENIHIHDEGPYICLIETSFIPVLPFYSRYDSFYLTVLVPPKLGVETSDDSIPENDIVTVTCTVPRVKPNITDAWIAIDNNKQIDSELSIETRPNHDKTSNVMCTFNIEAKRRYKGKKVTCHVDWNGGKVPKIKCYRT